MPMDRLKRGDYVRVRLEGSEGEWAAAFVALASNTNPSSVMLLMGSGSMVRTGNGGFVGGGLPLTIDYVQETVIALHGDSYEIEVGLNADALYRTRK